MTKRALLIGSQVHGLRGVDNDVASMERALRLWGFSDFIRCVTKPGPGDHRATAAGIRAGFRALIDAAESADVVIYYSGHGARALQKHLGTPVRRNAESLPEFIVPADIDDGPADEFRGITTIELSMLVAELTVKTRNITTIFDCCHAGRVVRGPSDKPSARDEPMRERFLNDRSQGIGEHIAALRGDPRMALVERDSNPHVVRVSACTPAQSAYEVRTDAGEYAGVLTHALQHALTQIKRAGQDTQQALSWRYLGDHVKSVVRGQYLRKSQTPSIDGPIDRVLFGLARQTTQGLATIARDRSRKAWSIQVGGLLGVAPGDEYAIMPMHKPLYPLDRAVGRAVVTEVHLGHSMVKVTPREPERRRGRGRQEIVNGSPVRLVNSAADLSHPVRLALPPDRGRALREAIVGSRWLREARDGDAAPLATVALSGEHISVTTEEGASREPLPTDSETGRAVVVSDLEKLAFVRMLLDLKRKSYGLGALDAVVDIEWGVVDEARVARPLARERAELHCGDRIYVHVQNRDQLTLYLSIFHIGVTGDIELLTTTSSAGVELEPGTSWQVGERFNALRGVELGWPAGTSRARSRLARLVLVVSDRSLDLSVFETAEPRVMASRDVALASDADVLCYASEHIEFSLSPTPRGASLG